MKSDKTHKITVYDMLDTERVVLKFVQRQVYTEEVCKFVQRQVYTEEVCALNQGQFVKRSSSLRQLDPYIDNGILNSR